jgi:protein-disulfide isomerase
VTIPKRLGTYSRLLFVWLIAARLTAITSGAPSDQVRPANALGSPTAPVTIEFFSDLQCPQCAKYEPIVKSVRAEFGDKVRLVLRHFPLSSHEHAALAACVAEAAANQGHFWEMAEALYRTQWMWGKAPAPRVIFRDQAKQLGMDLDQFEKDLDSPECRARVGVDAMYAQKIGIKTAPSIVINGYNVPNSEFNENGFRAAIKAALSKAGQ